ncbi:glycosyltransferase [Plantibacter sp. PA-3-X8]|uniref:glycosyltransferase n=1 Tax=unclassified Plantibacter TaxID=2624265 RepID=UPI0013DE06D6|nr:glycosyltransferase [Plantibacter sp. PA-3-X8]
MHPSAELYGSDRVLLESVAAYTERDVPVTVVLASDGPLVDELRRIGAEVEVTDLPVLRKSMLSPVGLVRLAGRSIVWVFRGRRLVRRVRPSVVYVSTVTIPIANVIARLSRIPLVVHVHEAEDSAGRLARFALSAPLHLAHRIVYNSGFSQRTVERMFPALAARSEIVLNGVTAPRTVHAPRPTLEGGIRVVYVGRLSARKGPDVVVEAIAQLPETLPASLSLVGAVYPGYEWFEEALRERVGALGLEERVAFEGFVDDAYPMISAADVMVVSSRVDEPFGNTAVEAMLAARPVVVSDTSGLREAAAGYESARFVAPGDASAIASAIESIATGWSDVREAAERDALVATERHSTASYREHLRTAVSRALQGRRSRGVEAAS